MTSSVRCAMGNCYSLQKGHETALKNFQRSVQLNSRFAYAHTLCGHEYVSLEDFENGIKSYQSALMVDSRHYNAWYGLGMIYLRQEKFEFSEHHFRMAFRINPLSSVIMSYLGTALHALKKNNEALEMMERAILADKKNPLPLYQKANILVSMENFDGALAVLEELKEYAPCESSVYALMGRIYKQLDECLSKFLQVNWSLKTNGDVDMTEQLPEHLSPATRDALVKVNMEAPVSGDDIVLAEGFGATKDISSSVSCAGGFTDMEAHLHDVQEYEDFNGKNSGLSVASFEDIPEVLKIDFKGNENVGEHVTLPGDSCEAIYMEASPTADEVIRAGGFGATDDISSFLRILFWIFRLSVLI